MPTLPEALRLENSVPLANSGRLGCTVPPGSGFQFWPAEAAVGLPLVLAELGSRWFAVPAIQDVPDHASLGLQHS
eukprot:1168029-Amphidinium_carterae.1